MLWCNAISSVDAFAFTRPSAMTASRTSSSTRLYETVEGEVNTLLRSATIYGEKVADENIR